MNLDIQVHEHEQETVAFVNGEVDVYTASKLKETITPLAEEENNRLVVDLAGVDYIDSTGLGIFIGALKTAEKSGSSLVLTGLNDRVRRLFEITGLHEVIQIDSARREEA
ncbi:STAS domain-containing protein [Alkalicoccus urumqiensis]|uniref:Anti-sigma factor antagonist n=1 Tax=Alkalicoccus urumqiensis TaxID=1548213 RepID=A0A2P6MHX0_ALKUR|nr:STAS domain-containing protein [Alkalicoccus urumqiensis]PRO65894.1 anti-anti-sigma factor [Alkalicoccus urumqiensis]